MNDRDTELAEMLDKIGTNFEKFKASNNETIAGLKNTVEKLETKLARPGAFLRLGTLERNEGGIPPWPEDAHPDTKTSAS